MSLSIHKLDRFNAYEWTLTERREVFAGHGPSERTRTSVVYKACLIFDADKKKWYRFDNFFRRGGRSLSRKNAHYVYFWKCWKARTFNLGEKA